MITEDIRDLRELLRQHADHPLLTLTMPTDPANHREAHPISRRVGR
jgi:hypothetical protein